MHIARVAGPTIALAMGEKGQITRLLAAKYGVYLTFAALSASRTSAPGQPTVQQMQGLYNFTGQNPSTKLFGIIGNPVHHSKSPLIHNTAFQHIGKQENWLLVAIHVHIEHAAPARQ